MPGVTSKEVFWIPKPGFLCRGLTQEALLEYEQAVIRILFTSLVVVYFLVHGVLDSEEGLFTTAFYLAGAYDLFSIVVLLSFAIYKKESKLRKMITMAGDHGMTCLAMYRAGEVGAPLFTVLLWITVGYGARFGMSYLYLGMLLSSTGLFVLVNTAGFWVAHPIPGYGMIVTNIIIPIFVSKLLKQLSDAKAKAELADEAKGRFLANMSHEMRTPLSGIIGISKLLYKEQIPGQIKSSIVTIDQSANHLLKLIDDVLNFSRIESGTLQIDDHEFDVYEAVHSVSENLRTVAEGKHLGFHVFISSDVPTSLVGDASRVKQILLNLCGNAIKFTTTGYVEIRVNALEVTDTLATLRFEIIDSGIGIPKQALEHVFDRFNQVDDSITRKFGGTGLGTTISKELVEMMGGQIHVQSDLGKGSRFYFDLPLRLGETRIDEEYSDAKCLIFSRQESLHKRLSGFALRWGMSIASTTELHEICRILVANKDEKGYPILLVDGASVDGAIEEFIKYVEFGVSDTLEMILVDTRREFVRCEGAFTAIVNDLSTPRQLFNAVHAANRKYELPSGVTDIAASQQSHFKKLKVLVAEDSRVNRLILEEILVSHGMAVITAQDGDEALDLFEDNTFDIAIVDMQMPNLGGLDVIREYNSGYGLFKKIPFIVLTANVSTDAKMECERAGATAYMHKPVDETKLLKLIYLHTGEGDKEEPESIGDAQTASGVQIDKDMDKLNMDVIKNLMTISKRKGFFKELLENYLQDLKTSIEIIRQASEHGDYERYRNEAHAIKGASANIGAIEVFNIARIANEDSEAEFNEYATSRNKDFSDALRNVEIAFKKLDEVKHLSTDTL
jgi:two-component system, sensor histidine kinase RpfC